MAFYRERGLKELTSEVTHEGVGIGGGFIVGGAVGRQVENMLFKTPVTPASPISNKLLAWLANNGAKGAVYLLAKHYDAESPFAKEATKALAGSIVYDTILRVANHGYNPADVSLSGYRILGTEAGMEPEKVQRLVQENTLLRTELNKALRKLSGVDSMPGMYRPAERFAGNIPGSEPWNANPDMPGGIRYGGAPSPAVAERQRQYGAMPTSADVLDRQRRYAQMPFEQNPNTISRQRKYGAMEQMGFMADAKDTSVAKMFNMQ